MAWWGSQLILLIGQGAFVQRLVDCAVLLDQLWLIHVFGSDGVWTRTVEGSSFESKSRI